MQNYWHNIILHQRIGKWGRSVLVPPLRISIGSDLLVYACCSSSDPTDTFTSFSSRQENRMLIATIGLKYEKWYRSSKEWGIWKNGHIDRGNILSHFARLSPTYKFIHLFSTLRMKFILFSWNKSYLKVSTKLFFT